MHFPQLLETEPKERTPLAENLSSIKIGFIFNSRRLLFSAAPLKPDLLFVVFYLAQSIRRHRC